MSDERIEVVDLPLRHHSHEERCRRWAKLLGEKVPWECGHVYIPPAVLDWDVTEIERLRAKKPSAADHAKRIAELEKELDEATRLVYVLYEQRDVLYERMATKDARIAELEKERDEMKQRIRELEKERDHWKDAYTGIKAVQSGILEDNARLEKERNAARAKAVELEKELERRCPE